LGDFSADVLAIGPGLGPNVSDDDLRDALARFAGPIVVDADGLNRLAGMGAESARSFAQPADVVLTPHPGEMSRLVAAWSIEASESDRTQCALAVARATGTIVVLKGFGTVVTDGQQVFVNQTGNSGMATGGAGDVLTGLIAALCGQGMPPFDAAVLGVYVHGLAGDMAAEEIGRMAMIATDIIDYLPDALSELEEENG
jgi:NAD(P)H-hydrate epimerase